MVLVHSQSDPSPLSPLPQHQTSHIVDPLVQHTMSYVHILYSFRHRKIAMCVVHNVVLRHRKMLTYTYDVVYDIVGKPTVSYTTWQHATGKNSPPTYYTVGKHKIVYNT